MDKPVRRYTVDRGHKVLLDPEFGEKPEVPRCLLAHDGHRVQPEPEPRQLDLWAQATRELRR